MVHNIMFTITYKSTHKYKFEYIIRLKSRTLPGGGGMKGIGGGMPDGGIGGGGILEGAPLGIVGGAMECGGGGIGLGIDGTTASILFITHR